MEIKLIKGEIEKIEKLPVPCRTCLYWEKPELCGKTEEQETIREKTRWFNETGRKFGPAGMYVDENGEVIAFIQFAPPEYFPNLKSYEEQLFRPDPSSVFISCIYVVESKRRQGIGSKLLREALKHLKEKGTRLVQTIARNDNPVNPSGPTSFYIHNGFKVIESKEAWGTTYSLVEVKLKD